MRYREGEGRSGGTMPLGYWKAYYHGDLRLGGIDPDWSISLQPMVNLEYYKELGGFDCQYEYSNHCHHDLIFRIQMAGGKIHNSPVDVCDADHFPGDTGDHRPIFIAQHQYDDPKFLKIYGEKKPLERIKIDYDNWKSQPSVWKLRYGNKLPTKYEELLN